MQSLDPLFARLSRSKFRSRFRLGVKERQYCLEKGAPVIEQHAADFVAKRLAPALPANDGKQTPCAGIRFYRSTRHRDLLSRLSGYGITFLRGSVK